MPCWSPAEPVQVVRLRRLRVCCFATILSVGAKGRFHADGGQRRLDPAIHRVPHGDGQQPVGQAEPVVEIAPQAVGWVVQPANCQPSNSGEIVGN